MRETFFTSVSLAKSFPLEIISTYFKLIRPLKWKDYILIEDAHLQTILRYSAPDHLVYIYDFGAITFVNFKIHEIKAVLDYLESIIGTLDYNLIMDSLETHILATNNEGMCRLWPTSDTLVTTEPHIIPITAEILAQSISMERIESVLSELYESAEILLKQLEKGRFKRRDKKMGILTGKVIKFQYDMIKSIHIFDRPKFYDASIGPKEIHEKLADYYELFDRYDIIETKSKDLLGMYESYLELSNKKTEYRMYMLQAFLLLLFPFNSILGDRLKPLLQNLISIIKGLLM